MVSGEKCGSSYTEILLTVRIKLYFGLDLDHSPPTDTVGSILHSENDSKFYLDDIYTWKFFMFMSVLFMDVVCF